MFLTVYLHPLRSVAMEWDISDTIPTLTSYKELEPVKNFSAFPSTVKNAFSKSEAASVIIHTSNAVFHSFPLGEDENCDERVAFELKEFFPEMNPSADVIKIVPHYGIAFGSKWISLCIIPQAIKRFVSNAFGSAIDLITDIEADVHAATLEEDMLLVGLRGSSLWVASTYNKQAPYHLDRLHVSANTPLEALIEEAIADHTDSLDKAWSSVKVFGDGITPTMLNVLSTSMFTRGKTVTRFNPFVHARARVDDTTQSSIIKRAHILSPMIGAFVHTRTIVPAPVT